MIWLDPDRVCHCLLHEPVEGQEASEVEPKARCGPHPSDP
jgi:hypothetical protein